MQMHETNGTEKRRPKAGRRCKTNGYAYSASTEVQWGQRVALMEMVLQQ